MSADLFMSQCCRSKHTQADLDRDGVDFATVDGFQVRLGSCITVISVSPYPCSIIPTFGMLVLMCTQSASAAGSRGGRCNLLLRARQVTC